MTLDRFMTLLADGLCNFNIFLRDELSLPSIHSTLSSSLPVEAIQITNTAKIEQMSRLHREKGQEKDFSSNSPTTTVNSSLHMFKP